MSHVTERVLRKNRDEAEGALAQLQLHALYETLPAPEHDTAGRKNLLQFLFVGTPNADSQMGVRLKAKIEALTTQIEQLDALLEVFDAERAAREAELDANPIRLADDPTDL